MTPERFRIVVSTVLIVGVSTAAVLIAAGFVGSLFVGWEGSLVGSTATPAPTTDLGSLVANIIALRPIALAQAGIIVLLLTPIVRVAASVLGFWLERDLLYVAITAAVLAILLGSLFVLR